jgi:hypothetical protein
MNCVNCGQPIPPERLEILPNTTTCVGCSTVKKNIVLPVYSHKTAPEMIVIPADDREAIRRAHRANQRSR